MYMMESNDRTNRFIDSTHKTVNSLIMLYNLINPVLPSLIIISSLVKRWTGNTPIFIFSFIHDNV